MARPGAGAEGPTENREEQVMKVKAKKAAKLKSRRHPWPCLCRLDHKGLPIKGEPCNPK